VAHLDVFDNISIALFIDFSQVSDTILLELKSIQVFEDFIQNFSSVSEIILSMFSVLNLSLICFITLYSFPESDNAFVLFAIFLVTSDKTFGTSISHF
jgi:hypothetical protein